MRDRQESFKHPLCLRAMFKFCRPLFLSNGFMTYRVNNTNVGVKLKNYRGNLPRARWTVRATIRKAIRQITRFICNLSNNQNEKETLVNLGQFCFHKE